MIPDPDRLYMRLLLRNNLWVLPLFFLPAVVLLLLYRSSESLEAKLAQAEKLAAGWKLVELENLLSEVASTPLHNHSALRLYAETLLRRGKRVSAYKRKIGKAH